MSEQPPSDGSDRSTTNKRRHYRSRSRLDARVIVLGPGGDEGAEHDGHTDDLSVSGVRVTLDGLTAAPVRDGDHVAVVVDAPEEEELTLGARVAWSRADDASGWVLGLEFTEVPERERMVLSELVLTQMMARTRRSGRSGRRRRRRKSSGTPAWLLWSMVAVGVVVCGAVAGLYTFIDERQQEQAGDIDEVFRLLKGMQQAIEDDRGN